MKASTLYAVVVVSLLCLTFTLSASAREMVLPAGTILKCTLDEPNFSSATAAIGDPVLCRLHSLTEFGQQAFPRGSYLIGHLEAAQDPGHFWGKGYMKIQFDRIGLPQGDMPLDAKVIATRGYKVDKYGDIDGKGHAKRDIVEWMIPPLWPWKIIMLPARGPRPALKGESQLTLRLMDDVEMPQVSQTFGPDWHFFGHPYNDPSYNPSSYNGSGYGNSGYDSGAYNGGSYNNSSYRNDSRSYGTNDAGPQLAVRQARSVRREPRLEEVPQVQYAVYKPANSGAAGYAQANVAETSTVLASDTRIAGTSPGVPVFVLKTGTVLAVGNYGYQDGRISYELASGGSGVISADEVDWTTTAQVNQQRGVRVLLPSGHMVSGTAGF
ncbi:MAG: hypothetical protein WB817_00520 [Terriglobales bacterium]